MLPLFNARTIKNWSENVDPTNVQFENATKWLNLLRNNKLEDEKSNYIKFQKIILEGILDYDLTSDLLFEKNNVEFQICDDKKKIIACFEVKGTKTKDLFAIQNRNKKEHSTPIKQTWDYLGATGAKYGICTNYNQFILISKQYGYVRTHTFDFTDIETDPKKLGEFIGIFGKDWLTQGDIIETLFNKSVEEEKEFTREFYKLYHETRLMLIDTFQSNGSNKSMSIEIAQHFLNRLMFVFFAEDHDFLEKKLFRKRIMQILDSSQATEHTTKIFTEIIDIFNAFDKGSKKLGIPTFNGGLFSGKFPDKIYFNDFYDKQFKNITQNSKITPNENLQKIIDANDDLNPIIINLLIMNSHDFNTEIGVNILGRMFEQSLSDLDSLRGNEKFSRKKDGVYYTPEYITDYICRNTIIPYLSKTSTNDVHELVSEYSNDLDQLIDKIKNLRILDPSCGSGAFLVQAANVLLEILKTIHSEKIHAKKIPTTTHSQYTMDDFSVNETMHMLIRNCIYGIDLNPAATEISKLSLFLKLANPTEKLPDLIPNIKNGNSVIHNKNHDPKALDWKTAFPKTFENGGFDIIIGNPPYVRQETLKDIKDYMQLPDNNTLGLKNFIIDRKSDLCVYFYYHSINNLKNKGMLGFITSNGWLHDGYGNDLKHSMLKNCNISSLLKTTYNIFEDAEIKTITTILSKEKINDNVVYFYNSLYTNELTSNKIIPAVKRKQNELDDGNWTLYFQKNLYRTKIPMAEFNKIANIRFGTKTGYNDFFVLDQETINKYHIPSKFLKPVLSNNIRDGLLADSDVSEYLLNVTSSKGKLCKSDDGNIILKYIEHMEKIDIKTRGKKICKIHELSSLRNRKQWYSLTLYPEPPIITSRFAHKNIRLYENNGNFLTRNNFINCFPFKKSHTRAILAYLRSSYFALYMEKNGRIAGGGALEFLTLDYKKSIVPDFNQLSDDYIERMGKAWITYCDDFNMDKLDESVLSMLGFSNPEQSQIKSDLQHHIDFRTKSFVNNKSNLLLE